METAPLTLTCVNAMIPACTAVLIVVLPCVLRSGIAISKVRALLPMSASALPGSLEMIARARPSFPLKMWSSLVALDLLEQRLSPFLLLVVRVVEMVMMVKEMGVKPERQRDF